VIWDSDSEDEVGTGTGMVVGGHGMGKQSCGNVLGIRSLVYCINREGPKCSVFVMNCVLLLSC